MRPLVLLTNDDGVHAPGLKALAQAVESFADWLIVAPHVERSGAGQGISLTTPLRVERLGPTTYAVEGTPADCVIFALNRLVPRRPDFVISGINRGSNIGQDTLYSGTIAAAMEGAVHGIPALAVSLRVRRGVTPERYDTAAAVVRALFAEPALLAPAAAAVLSVNVPDLAFEELRGYRVAGLGRRIYDAHISEGVDPRGRPYYWIGGGGELAADLPGSDCALLSQGFVTLTALTPDHANVPINEALRAGLQGALELTIRHRE